MFVAIITLAFMVALQLVFIEEQRFTGGQNGLTGLAPLELGGWMVDTYGVGFYYLVAGCLMVALLLGALVTRSKVGLILRAIREDNMRVRYFGYDVALYETVVFCISAAIGGLGGDALHAGAGIRLAHLHGRRLQSGDGEAWVAVGGRESLLGAAVGAILVNLAEGRLSDLCVKIVLWL